MEKVYTSNYEHYNKDNIIDLNDSDNELSKRLYFNDNEYNKLYDIDSGMNEIIKSIICTNLYYNKVLKNIDVNELLNEVGNKVIVSGKKSNEFDYRHLIAFYLELMLGIETSEIKLNEDGTVEKVNRPEYLKRILEKTMKIHIQSKGNTTLTYKKN